jgi:hypothetical protein
MSYDLAVALGAMLAFVCGAGAVVCLCVAYTERGP